MIPRDDPKTSKVPDQRSASSEIRKASTASDQLPPPPGGTEIGLEQSIEPSAQAFRGQVDKAKAFGAMAFGVLVDLAFLIVWVLLQQSAHWIIRFLGELPGMRRVFLAGMEYLFDGATLALVAAYVLRDVWLSIQRIWRSK